MKKKRFLPMCLCLVLALGLSACNDLEDLADSGGDDETSEVGPTETGDDTEPGGGEGPSESVPTYSIQIVDPSGDLQLEVGESATIAVSLVTTVDNTDSSVAGTASEVTLSSSNSSVVSVEGLTITALDVGDAVITATWTEHGVTSSDLHVTVTAPVYTPTIEYSIAITSPSSDTSVLTNNPITIGVSLITTVDGTPTSEEGSAETVKLNISPETSSVTVDGLTIIGTVAETVTITATWKDKEVTSEPITITFVEPSAEPVITYGITITNPTSETALNVGSELTVAATLYTYSDEAVSASEAATADNVTVTSDTSSTGSVDISGLTITGKSAGSVTLIVKWGEYATSSVTFAVESVYTYKAVITSPTEYSYEVGTPVTIGVDLITTKDGVPTTEAGTAETVTLVADPASAVTISGLTVTGSTSGTVAISATWNDKGVTSEPISLTFTEPIVEDSYTFSVKLTDSTGADFSEPGETYALFICTDYDIEPEASWNTYQMSYDSATKLYSYKFDVLQTSGEGYTIDVYAGYATNSEPNWSRKIGSSTITPTGSESGAVTDTVTLTPVFSSFTAMFTSSTFTVTIGELGVADTTRIHLYAAGDFNNWGDPTELTPNNDTYTLTLDFTPSAGKSFEVIGYDSSSETDDGNIWSHEYIATYTFTAEDISGAASGSVSITATTSFSSWSDVFTGLGTGGGEQGEGGSGFISYTITVALYSSDGTTLFPIINDDSAYGVYINTGFDTGGDSSSWSTNKMTNNNNGTYSYTYSTLPDAGSYSVVIYAGDASGVSWSHQLGERFTVTVTGNETGEYQATSPYKITITTGTDWDDLFALGDEETFYVVFVDNSGVSSLTKSVEIQCGTQCFNGTTKSSVTATKTSNNYLAWYSDAGTLKESESDWFSLTNGTDWMAAGEITIPSNANGTPVYVAVGYFTGWEGNASSAWNADQTGSGWQYLTNGQTIASFVASLSI